jgi:hypothetical protein
VSDGDITADDGTVLVDSTGSDQPRSAWEFWDVPPTTDQVRELLATLRPVYGVKTVDYLDYVQALPQTKKIPGRILDSRGKRDVETKRETWSLYMSVGGRVAMLAEAQELNHWTVEHQPEMHTPDGCPTGYVQYDDRIVYREYVVISVYGRMVQSSVLGGGDKQTLTILDEPIVLGSKAGTAWVPRTGGSQAKGSNPFEKVETAARGRAIGAWSFGVLPGSGIASLEEMLGVPDNEAAAGRDRGNRRGSEQEMPSREELLEQVAAKGEEARQLLGAATEDWNGQVATYLTEVLMIRGEVLTADGNVDWSRAKDGQLQLAAARFQQLINTHNAQQPL